MKQNLQPKYHYFDAVLQQHQNLLRFSSLADLQRYIQLHNVRTIYRLRPSEISGTETGHHFAFLHNGTLIQQDAMGFETLEDHSQAMVADFPDASSFYKATADGYTRFKDYELVLQCGIEDKTLFEQISKAGFIEGFERYTTLLGTPDNNLPDIGTFANARELYDYAQLHHFDTYDELIQALTKGFTDALDEQVAHEKGFTNAATFREAEQKGFTIARDYEAALKHHWRDFADGRRFNDLESQEAENCLHDEKLLLSILSRMQPGKRISINKLEYHLQESIDSYRYPDDDTLPLWFKTRLNDTAALASFLCRNVDVKPYGSYDQEGEYFEISHIRERAIVIDGSNVAFNSKVEGNDSGGRRGRLKNIERLALFLKEKGFKEIAVIADASLRHRVTDIELLSSLKTITNYLEAPAGRAADVFLISYIKKHRCLLVTNDNFREWKVADPWLALNMDYYRLSFLISEEDILMPDLLP